MIIFQAAAEWSLVGGREAFLMTMEGDWRGVWLGVALRQLTACTMQLEGCREVHNDLSNADVLPGTQRVPQPQPLLQL